MRVGARVTATPVTAAMSAVAICGVRNQANRIIEMRARTLFRSVRTGKSKARETAERRLCRHEPHRPAKTACGTVCQSHRNPAATCERSGKGHEARTRRPCRLQQAASSRRGRGARPLTSRTDRSESRRVHADLPDIGIRLRSPAASKLKTDVRGQDRAGALVAMIRCDGAADDESRYTGTDETYLRVRTSLGKSCEAPPPGWRRPDTSFLPWVWRQIRRRGRHRPRNRRCRVGS